MEAICADVREATVCYLSRGLNGSEEFLLGKRMKLFMNGRWQGPGGKLTPYEQSNGRAGIVRCLQRETRQEVSVLVKKESATHIASVDFHHLEEAGGVLSHHFRWRVHFFTVTAWERSAPHQTARTDVRAVFLLKGKGPSFDESPRCLAPA
ncbi:MAG TPA: NUDIX domain-containing protein [Candidatus Paceibacterota bacterium]|nr:NUDIX domain-containing protein [Candidatus Paceibacterota bacterium]